MSIAKKLCFLLIVLSAVSKLKAQQVCGNCKEPPTVAQFDFDIKVRQPNAADGTENLWPEWKNLFMIANTVGTKLANISNGCLKISTPLAIDTGGTQIMIIGSETWLNLPDNPNISDIKQYGQYLLTGTITQQGSSCTVHAEIQTSCGRKVVVIADATFQLASLMGNVSAIADQIVQQMSPLSEKIKKFELEERQKNKSLSLFQTNPEGFIKVTPQKTSLKAEESTGVIIELKDCDGIPLAGRDILFNETTFEGFKINGTIGGTFNSPKAVTDANGIATATFTLKGGVKEAIINVHSPGFDLKGCSSMFTGTAFINVKRKYLGNITYSFEKRDQCKKQTASESTIGESSWNHLFKVDYWGIFYTDENGFFSLEKDENYVKKKDTYGSEGGGTLIKQSNSSKITVKGVGAPTVQTTTKNQSGSLKEGTVRFALDKGAPFVEVNLKFFMEGNFSFKQTHLPTSSGPVNEEYIHSVAFMHIDNNFKYEQIRSDKRVGHIFTYYKTQSFECTNVIEKMRLTIIEE